MSNINFYYPKDKYVLNLIKFIRFNFFLSASFSLALITLFHVDLLLEIPFYTFFSIFHPPWGRQTRREFAVASGFNISAGWSRDSRDWLSKFSRDEKWKYTVVVELFERLTLAE